MATIALQSFPAKEFVNCPQCGADIVLYDPRGSEFCTCASCQAYIQFNGDEPKKLKVSGKLLLPPVIPLGTEGIIQDISFKVIGYIEKDEGTINYAWREYILYNYEKGYAVLSEYDGHWNLIFGKNFLEGLEKPLDGKDYVMYQDVEYKLFHKYQPRVVSLSGEFDWDVLKERLNVREFIAPPYILIKEQATFQKSVEYYRGEYLDPQVVAGAFGISSKLMPSKAGILSNQPSKAYVAFRWSLATCLMMILALLLIEYFISFQKPETVVLDEIVQLTSAPEVGANEFKPAMSKSFDLNSAASVLELNISTDVSNNWLETTMVLVNEANNQTWEVTKGVEFYEGIDEGEKWTEGEKSADVVISGIPKGRYHLNIYPAAGNPFENYLNVKVTANKTLWRNVFVAVLGLCLFPLISMILMYNFEKKRWSNSDYSPYHK